MVDRSKTCNLDSCLSSGDVGPDAECGKMFASRTSARPLTGHGTSNLNLNPSPFVAFAMKLETTNEPLFLEVEEAKRVLLLIAHCGLSFRRCKEVRLRR